MGQGAVIGLDIGNTTIKMAEVRAAKGGAQVTALGIAPTPLDSMTQNTIVDPGAVASAIKELLASSGARARKVVSSVAGQQSLVIRIIEVPRMTTKELAETMKWEVERHVPFASSELQMDYQVIDRPDAPPESQTMEVLLVAAQQDMILSHLEAVESAGLDPLAVDVEPLAMSRALVDINQNAAPGRTVALVNIGAQSTDISIVRDGNLLFQRTIATAGDALTQAIADTLNVSKEEADRIKKLHAVVDMDSFAQPAAAEDVFGSGGGDAVGDENSPFGFGPPVFEAPAEEPATEEPTLFNPFASTAEEPKPEEASALNPFAAPEESAPNPFATAEESTPEPQAAPPGASAAEDAPQWSPFGPVAEEDQDSAASAAALNPFAAPEAAEPVGNEASPFGDAGGEGDNAFDLSAFGVSPEEAAAAAESAAEGSELTPSRVFAIIKEPLADLVTEIKRSVDYFLNQSSEAAIDVVMLSGGTARLANLDQLLAGELGLPVVVSDPFQSVPVHATQYPAEYLRQVAPLFTVAIGLGLRETVF